MQHGVYQRCSFEKMIRMQFPALTELDTHNALHQRQQDRERDRGRDRERDRDRELVNVSSKATIWSALGISKPTTISNFSAY